MSIVNVRSIWAARAGWFSSIGRERQIMDYLHLANQLFLQRQVSFLTAAILTGFYYSASLASICYAFLLLTEALDMWLARLAKSWNGKDPVLGGKILRRIARNTGLSAIAISFFVIVIAFQQTSGGHFMPLMFLFSASLFAAMYNSQMLFILILRLSIYFCAFVFIAFLDVLRYRPPLKSEIWLEFFTILFVICFLIEISWQFYLLYRRGLEQMKQIEKESERAKAALEVKSQFVSIVSHELRTPLTSIRGSIELINSGRMGEITPKVSSLLEIAGRNSHRLSVLVDDLLDLQKIEAGEMSFRFESLDVQDLIRDAVEETSGFALKLGVDITTELEAEGSNIEGDRIRLVQALQNLISNALKFSHEGGTVTVRAQVIQSRVRISVHDTGVGIPEDAEDRVFGKFLHIDSSDRRKVGGTGLGLNITKQIAERHNAIVSYESTLGKGSTFYLEFDCTTAGGKKSPALPVAAPARSKQLAAHSSRAKE